MAIDAIQKMLNDLPAVFNAQTNPIVKALITAWASSDNDILTQLDNAKAQLFVKTASGAYLDRLASGVGVNRPINVGLNDATFSQLIPNLSFKSKAIFKAFYDTGDVFWGPLYSRANVTGSQNAPFNVTVGSTFTITVDSQTTTSITIKTGDIAVSGAATAFEVVDFLNQISDITASVVVQPSGQQNINVRTNSPGLRGSILIDSVNSLPGLGLPAGQFITLDNLSQRAVVYQLSPGEVIIEIPAFIPITSDTLKGSAHLHADSTISPPVPPGNGIWQGSFFYSTAPAVFIPTSQTAILEQAVSQGSAQNTLTVNSTAGLPSGGGILVVDFGKEAQEYGLKYFAVLNSQTIEVDPSYLFENEHFPGEIINFTVPTSQNLHLPRPQGQDFAVYIPSEVTARNAVENLLESIAAAGIVVKFIVLLPKYDYIIDNPFNT